MAYNKTTWSNGQAPGINDTNLNKIEQGIYDNSVNIGDLSDLDTTEKSNLVGAVNEVQENVDNTNTNIGDLSNLDTTEKSSLVGAINELKAGVDGIIESGSNENGNYIKYADGTMICTKDVVITTAINQAWGVLYESGRYSLGNFAESFIAPPIENASVCYSDGVSSVWAAFVQSVINITATSAGNIGLARPSVVNTAQPHHIHIIAIGKWK